MNRWTNFYNISNMQIVVWLIYGQFCFVILRGGWEAGKEPKVSIPEANPGSLQLTRYKFRAFVLLMKKLRYSIVRAGRLYGSFPVSPLSNSILKNLFKVVTMQWNLVWWTNRHTLQRKITHLAVITRKTNRKLGILKGGKVEKSQLFYWEFSIWILFIKPLNWTCHVQFFSGKGISDDRNENN